MKDRLKEHMEGWRFCEKCGMKLIMAPLSRPLLKK